MTRHSRRPWIIAALALAGLAVPALAEPQSEAGSFEAAYVKREVQPIAEGHILLLSEASGTNKSAGGSGRLDGFAVSVRETVDLDKGNGPHLGYTIFSRGEDRQIVRMNGKVTTTIKDGQPSTTMTGTWQVVDATGNLAGTRGEGTYSGYFLAEDKYHVDWKGLRMSAEPKSAKR